METYKHFNDAQSFQPIESDCAVSNSESNKNCNKLTTVATYKTRYFNSVGKQMTISFGFGEFVSVSLIIGLPTLREWKIVLDVDGGIPFSKLLNINFDLAFQHDTSGFPDGII